MASRKSTMKTRNKGRRLPPIRARKALASALLGAAILLLLSLNGYVVLNRSGHTGLDIRILAPLFVAIIVLIICLHSGRARNHSMMRSWISVAVVAVSAAGLVEIFLLDRLAIMLPYETWLRRGMP